MRAIRRTVERRRILRNEGNDRRMEAKVMASSELISPKLAAGSIFYRVAFIYSYGKMNRRDVTTLHESKRKEERC
jgi:hypothetical protein